MTEAQIQLQNALLTTFLANLAFLSEYDNDLYHKIDELSCMIENGTYEEKYALDFIMENGDFDIYDITNDKYLYNKNPQKFNNKAVSQINFDTKGSFSIIEPLYISNNNFLESPELFKDNIFLEKGFLQKKDLDEFRKILKEDFSNYKHKKLKNIDKFIFIGTLLGRHIPLIIKKTNAKNFMVCEQNLEIFRLSLFVIDYSILARDGRTVVFSIMDKIYEFSHKGSNFLRNDYHQNHVIKYFTTDFNVSKYFDQIMDAIVSEQTEGFNYYMMLDNVAKLALSRIDKYKVIQRELVKEADLYLKNKPVLYIGAGPSLNENLDWILKNKDKFIIVSMGASCKRLLSKGIIPDIVGTVDPQYKVLNEIHFSDEIIEKLKNTIILASMNTDQRILDKFNQNNLFLYEVIFTINHKSKVENGYSIGEILGTILINLGVNNIYLIGIDLAINQETGETHISGYETSNTFNLKNIKSSIEKDAFSTRQDLVKVKGNFIDEVYTSRLFNTSLNTFSLSCETLKDESQKIYNLSKNGAYIDSTEPLDIDTFDVEKFDSIEESEKSSEIKNDFIYLSKNYLTNEVIKELQIERDYLFDIKMNFLEKNKEYASLDEFTNDYLILEKKLLVPEIKTTFTTSIFSFYLRAVMPYIYYCLNDKALKKENEKLNKISKELKKQLLEISNKYLGYLDLVLKK
ncbi:6-hydroxymethylpterin diphosphokinase MptE-like protein [Arcobacter aquimarinus]|uniref:Motility accessory factor n=3 Tax=Arcobacter aquimarinus TaxID=1315211 RepID=A0AAE7E2K8_9BACT|nr:6-hydroxymethylpterin diphosphokinase MptE-like protein [Arcobacter aquimarinus]QKE27067.1 motility accessory factor [Arcobacter aquimarinus]